MSRTLFAAAVLVAGASAFGIVRDFTDKVTPNAGNSSLPVVFMHGMGDSCFNSGMKSITDAVATHLGVYGVCIPTGDNVNKDTNNGFFMTMNDNVDEWAKRVKADPKLANGFNAVGFSQGTRPGDTGARGGIAKW